MLDLNPTLLTRIVADAKTKAVGHPRWITAIDRAVVELESNPYVEWDGAHLLIMGSSGVTHSANGVCDCEAYKFKQPCFHRAAARLVRLYFEALDAESSQHISEQARVAYAQASLPPSRRPLFAERDAEDMRRAALAEEKAALRQARLARAKEVADAFNRDFFR